MKKVFAFILALFILLTSFAFADHIDLSSMSYNELKSLQNKLETEISNREKNGPGYSLWFDYGVGMHIPKPVLASGEELELGDILDNDYDLFLAEVKNFEFSDLDSYVNLLIAFGYTNIEERNENMFYAENADGYKIELDCFDSGLSIMGTAP